MLVRGLEMALEQKCAPAREVTACGGDSGIKQKWLTTKCANFLCGAPPGVPPGVPPGALRAPLRAPVRAPLRPYLPRTPPGAPPRVRAVAVLYVCC